MQFLDFLLAIGRERFLLPREQRVDVGEVLSGGEQLATHGG